MVECLQSEEERVQLGALVALRVLVSMQSSNISDFSRANGFPVLFKMIRGNIKTSDKVLAQVLVLLR